jgi:leucyl aminopeptidase
VPIEFTLSQAKPADVAADLLAVPVFAGRELGPGGDAVDTAVGGSLRAFLDEADFDGKPGQTLAVPTNGRLGANAAILVGLGARSEVTVDGVRRAAAQIARRATKVETVATTLLDALPSSIDRSAASQAIAEGATLGAYQYLEYKRDGGRSKLGRMVVLGRGGARVERGLARGATTSHVTTWARDLVNVPSIDKAPASIVAAAKETLKGTGVRVTVWAGQKLVDERLGGVVGVGQGSSRPPQFMKLSWSPRGARSSVGLVGKGVVFDSGGISIKPAAGMERMKTDMSGAAAVIATMSALKDLDVRHKVTGYVPLVENMPSGDAIRPGDVLRHRNGKTVEVINTDAEGRLILADALSLAAEDGVDAVVDLATLTGSCMVALGEEYAGLMGNNESWIHQIEAAAARAGEKVWHLPLPKEYRKQLDSYVADMRNVGDGQGGALTAGLFLAEFVGNVPWAHLDIAGPARAFSDDGYITKGGTGFGVRTLLELVSAFKKP